MSVLAVARLVTTGNADPVHLDTVVTALETLQFVTVANYISYEQVNIVLWTLEYHLPGVVISPDSYPGSCIATLLEHGYVTTGTFDPSLADGQP